MYFACDHLTPKVEAKIKTRGISFSQYAGRPVDFALEVLGIKYITPDIQELLRSVVVNKVTNVQAAHGLGKVMPSAQFWFRTGFTLLEGLQLLRHLRRDKSSRFFGQKLGDRTP